MLFLGLTFFAISLSALVQLHLLRFCCALLLDRLLSYARTIYFIAPEAGKHELETITNIWKQWL